MRNLEEYGQMHVKDRTILTFKKNAKIWYLLPQNLTRALHVVKFFEKLIMFLEALASTPLSEVSTWVNFIFLS